MTKNELYAHKGADFRKPLLDYVDGVAFVANASDSNSVPANIDEICIYIYKLGQYIKTHTKQEILQKSREIKCFSTIGGYIITYNFVRVTLGDDDSLYLDFINESQDGSLVLAEMYQEGEGNVAFDNCFGNSTWFVEDLGNDNYRVTRKG